MLSPKSTEVPAIVISALSMLLFGIALKPNVNVSLRGLADIVRPAPDEDAKVKLPLDPLANNSVPPNDAVANAFCVVTDVRYPASLFSCEILLPDTTTFFQVATFYVPILYKYGYQSKPTKKDPDVKYIAPFGADPVNSML